MDFSIYSGSELIKMYGELLEQMKTKNVIRSKNVTGDLGEYIVVEYYTNTSNLPKLQFAPPSTQNIDAISINGERYSIKTTTTTTTGVFYGLTQDADPNMRPLFEYVVVVKLDDNFQPELILEVDWDVFFRHKHWHSRVRAYNLVLTKKLIADSKVIYRKDEQDDSEQYAFL